MNIKPLLLLTFALLPGMVMAQKHDANMLFGYFTTNNDPLLGGASINFNMNPPLIKPDKQKIDMSFYCGICSDSTGQLAFYSNGISIRDTTHKIMLNGDTINPGYFWLSWQKDYYPNGPFCFALPAPGQHNQYYFFHMAADINDTTAISSPFYYTVVDMNGNNGLGEVTQKNQVLLPAGNDYIDPVAVKHGNGRDWWIIAGELSTPNIFTFLLDPEGVHGPFETQMPFHFPGREYQSVNDMSPDGRTYVRCDGLNGLYVFDFDRCSGTLSNQRVLPFADESFFGFATVFAADSRHLYVSSFETVTVLDLQAPDISASFDTIAYVDGQASPFDPFVTSFFIPNLAADGKIYYSTTNGTLSLHVIHEPNLPGHSADLEQHGVDLPKFNSGTMCQYPNYRLGEWEGSPCDTVNGQRPGDGFEKTDYYPPTVYKPAGYTMLPPIGKSRSGSDKPRAIPPNAAQMAIKQMQARKLQAQEASEQSAVENKQ